MMHPLSLHHLVVPDISSVALVHIAARLDCRHVCLFTQDPDAGMAFPIVRKDDIAELRHVMDGEGVSAWGLASFALTPDLRVDAYRPAIERGARLGGRRANVRVLDLDESRAIEKFSEFCALCAEYGIVAGIEFTGFGMVNALPQAQRIVSASGKGGIALDALHVVRTGVTEASLRQLDPKVISYVQLCDGSLDGTTLGYAREGALDRLPPGAGEFPLRAIVGLIAPDFPLSLEVPCERWRVRGVAASERALRVVDATRRFLAELPD